MSAVGHTVDQSIHNLDPALLTTPAGDAASASVPMWFSWGADVQPMADPSGPMSLPGDAPNGRLVLIVGSVEEGTADVTLTGAGWTDTMSLSTTESTLAPDIAWTAADRLRAQVTAITGAPRGLVIRADVRPS